MPEPEHVRAVVSEWITKANNDLKTAAHTLKLGKSCPTDTVAFHAQQCIEKLLKALLIADRIDFPKTHDIGIIYHLLDTRSRPAMSIEEQEKISSYAIGPRYPGFDEISLTEARKAVSLARRIKKEVQKLLKAALPK